ncbi:hypothetical protein KCP73_07150 [Salmonella enterica subsp. enterica]|nr:hypothetical protein KCP73_07150 [Salmonella enterica subsp. enterica]
MTVYPTRNAVVRAAYDTHKWAIACCAPPTRSNGEPVLFWRRQASMADANSPVSSAIKRCLPQRPAGRGPTLVNKRLAAGLPPISAKYNA